MCYPPFWKEVNEVIFQFYFTLFFFCFFFFESNYIPKNVNHNNSSVIDTVEIANILNNHFAYVVEKTRANVNYSNKHFSEYMENESPKSFSLSPTNKSGIWSIISNLNPNKPVGPFRIPAKIFKLMKDEISSHLSVIYNIAFPMHVFPSVLKTVKAIPVHKKDSKLQ